MGPVAYVALPCGQNVASTRRFDSCSWCLVGRQAALHEAGLARQRSRRPAGRQGVERGSAVVGMDIVA